MVILCSSSGASETPMSATTTQKVPPRQVKYRSYCDIANMSPAAKIPMCHHRKKSSACLHVEGRICMCQMEWSRIALTPDTLMLHIHIHGLSIFLIQHLQCNLPNVPGSRTSQAILVLLVHNYLNTELSRV